MGFSNPIVGGGGGLVYPSIHSPNFVTGVSGWTINKDGSAEFDNLVIRGTFNGTDFILNATGLFFYSGTPANGNLIQSITNAPGTDDFGNAYVGGFYQASNTNVSWVQIFNGILSLNDNSAGFIESQLAAGQWISPAGNGASGSLVAQNPVSGGAETWHALSLSNSWGGNLSYRLLADGRVEISAAITSNAATAAGVGTIPAAYRPKSTQYLAMGANANVASGISPFLQITTAGAVNASGLHAFVTAGTFVCNGSYPINL